MNDLLDHPILGAVVLTLTCAAWTWALIAIAVALR